MLLKVETTSLSLKCWIFSSLDNQMKERKKKSLLFRLCALVASSGAKFDLSLTLLQQITKLVFGCFMQTLGIEHAFSSFIWLCGPITGLVVCPLIYFQIYSLINNLKSLGWSFTQLYVPCLYLCSLFFLHCNIYVTMIPSQQSLFFNISCFQ